MKGSTKSCCPHNKKTIHPHSGILPFSMAAVIFILLAFFFTKVFSQEVNDFQKAFCGSSPPTEEEKYLPNSTYGLNLNSVLASRGSFGSESGFYNISLGQNPNRVYLLALCRGDLTRSQCNTCLENATENVPLLCPLYKEAFVFYDNCMLRYSPESIFGVVDTFHVFWTYNPSNATDNSAFNNDAWGLMDDLKTEAAASSSMFATGTTRGPDFATIYGLAQCSPDMSQNECDSCFGIAINDFGKCCDGRKGARVVSPNCNMRYELTQFYNITATRTLSPTPPAPPPTGKNHTRIIIVVVSVVGVILVVVTVLFIYRRRKGTKLIRTDYGNDIVTEESLQYEFETIREATNDFSEENKEGRGGFGQVYKGKLANGQEIAVKRLTRGYGQGDQEFKTEVLLLAKLRHRNMVRLIGFCLGGEERILIYQFMPNSSLDRFIFNDIKRKQLDWGTRKNILVGIARGLGYLHEDSQLRIIHRDLKPSNVLLDEDMTPKIADFGMARLFETDATHDAASRIVGTPGYMAPEYLLYGHISAKSDIFSFGIMILEIISGQKSTNFHSSETGTNLLSFAWKNWREETVWKMTDLSLNEAPRSEIQRWIQIGLLCVQENAASRPNTHSVLMMLSNFTFSIPSPSHPPIHMPLRFTDSEIDINTSKEARSEDSGNIYYQSSINEVTITDILPRL